MKLYINIYYSTNINTYKSNIKIMKKVLKKYYYVELELEGHMQQKNQI